MDSYNKLIQVGYFLFKPPPLSSTMGSDAYDPASRDHFGDEVETNLSSQSKTFSRGSEYMYMYSASEKTSKSIQTVGSPGGLTVPVRGLPLVLKPSAMVRSREAWPYFPGTLVYTY